MGVGHTEHHLHRLVPGLGLGLPAQDDVEAGPGVLQEVGDCPLVIRRAVTGVGHQCDVPTKGGKCQTGEKQFDFTEAALRLSRPHKVDNPVRIPIISEQRISLLLNTGLLGRNNGKRRYRNLFEEDEEVIVREKK